MSEIRTIRTILTGLAFAMTLIAVAEGFPAEKMKVVRIDPKALNRIMEYKEPHLLINVAGYLECMDAKIPGSLCLSCDREKDIGDILPGNKGTKLVFYGGNGSPVSDCRLIEEAARRGFSRIYSLRGGLSAWRRAGYEIETAQRIPRTPSLSVKPKDLPNRLKQMKRPLILDIRDAAAFERGHLDGARNIPFSVLHLRYQDIPLDRTLLIVDEDGSRAFLASSYLARKGLPNAARLAGGMNAWQAYEKGSTK